jgi:hypothetical protein
MSTPAPEAFDFGRARVDSPAPDDDARDLSDPRVVEDIIREATETARREQQLRRQPSRS